MFREALERRIASLMMLSADSHKNDFLLQNESKETFVLIVHTEDNSFELKLEKNNVKGSFKPYYQ